MAYLFLAFSSHESPTTMKRFLVTMLVCAPDDVDESEVAGSVNACLDIGLGEFTSQTEEIEIPEAAARAKRLLRMTFGEPEVRNKNEVE